MNLFCIVSFIILSLIVFVSFQDFIFNLMQLDDLPEVDCLLITQSLDDHCHLNTLRPLSKKSPDVKVIATPNAKPLLDPLFRNVRDLFRIS